MFCTRAASRPAGPASDLHGTHAARRAVLDGTKLILEGLQATWSMKKPRRANEFRSECCSRGLRRWKMVITEAGHREGTATSGTNNQARRTFSAGRCSTVRPKGEPEPVASWFSPAGMLGTTNAIRNACDSRHDHGDFFPWKATAIRQKHLYTVIYQTKKRRPSTQAACCFCNFGIHFFGNRLAITSSTS